MRHSTIDLTMNVYTDPKLLDIQQAVESLPAMPLNPPDWQANRDTIAVNATGTDDSRPRPFAPAFAPTSGNSSKSLSIADKTADERGPAFFSRAHQAQVVTLSKETTRCHRLTTGCVKWSGRELNPRPSHCERDALPTELPPRPGLRPDLAF